MAEAKANGTGVSQADMLAAILRELAGVRWVNGSMAVPHVMKFLKGVSDGGVQLGAFDVEAVDAGQGRSAPCVLASVTGRDADGVERRLSIDLAACYGVVRFVMGRSADCVKATEPGEPVTYTSEATAREFAGISVPADARHARGVSPAPRACDATGAIPGADAPGYGLAPAPQAQEGRA